MKPQVSTAAYLEHTRTHTRTLALRSARLGSQSLGGHTPFLHSGYRILPAGKAQVPNVYARAGGQHGKMGEKWIGTCTLLL